MVKYTLLLLITLALLGQVLAGTWKTSINEKPGDRIKNITKPLDSCGGNCPSGDCPSGNCPCGTTSNPVNIQQACAQGSWDQTCCQCIVSHESGGNANAMNYNDNGSFDVGVWQINDVNWACNGGSAPCDPAANFKCALAVYSASGDWSPWSTCGGCNCCQNGGTASSSSSPSTTGNSGNSNYEAGIPTIAKYPANIGGKGKTASPSEEQVGKFEF